MFSGCKHCLSKAIVYDDTHKRLFLYRSPAYIKVSISSPLPIYKEENIDME